MARKVGSGILLIALKAVFYFDVRQKCDRGNAKCDFDSRQITVTLTRVKSPGQKDS